MKTREVQLDKKPSYESILDESSLAAVVTDRMGRILYANRIAGKTFHFQREKAVGTFISEVLPVSSALLQGCLQTPESKLGQHIVDNRLGLVMNVYPAGRPGKTLGMICTFQKTEQFEDTVKRLRSYTSLNKLLETIFESSSDGLWVCDGQGKVIRINDASARLNGVKPDQVIGKKSEQIVAEGVVDRSAVLQVLENKRKMSIMQYLPRTKKQVLVTATPSFDEEGNVYLVVLNERDMTQLNAMRAQLEKALEMTEKVKEEMAEIKMLGLQAQDIVAASQKMRHVLRIAHKLGTMRVSDIMVSGESGTGKGVIAKFIHEVGKRARKPFLQINCAAIPESLLEAELFGYEKGAFTGAKDSGKPGLFELAHEGTLFLDEIGDLPLSVQAKLLKYLDDHEVMRLGAVKSSKVDCVIVTATNRDLEGLVESKKFRDDLYYRLSTFRIEIPPLRERPEDIFELVHNSLSKLNKLYGLNRKISQRGFDIIRSYPFPGNVRELENLIRMAVVMSEHDLLDESIRESLDQAKKSMQDIGTGPNFQGGLNLHEELMKAEKEIIRSAVMRSKSTKEVADFLGVSQPTAFRKMKKHRLAFDSIMN